MVAVLVTATPAPRAQETAKTVWLCRPGLSGNPCESDLTATLIDGTKTSIVTTPRPAESLPVDCFYVYPTVSGEPAHNADLAVEPAERDVAIEQASRFSTVCNVWAPMYREITETALNAGQYDDPRGKAVAYSSLLDAWRDYIEHENNGRPIVFIGHSQGAQMLTLLLREEVDRNDVLRSRMISALLVGGNVSARTGADAGGSFANIPACRSQTQTGCVIAYSTFDEAPPKDAFFGVSRRSEVSAICTNPAALSGGSAALDSFFRSDDPKPPVPVTTPWTEYRDLFVAACMHRDNATWLQVTRNPATRRSAPSVGAYSPQWGLHIFDVDIALGNLVDDVAAQEHAYAQHQMK